MTTPEDVRCKDCSLCTVSKKTGRLTCSEWDRPVDEVPDEDCPVERGY